MKGARRRERGNKYRLVNRAKERRIVSARTISLQDT
jgi:hypothetical protein